MIRKFLIYLFPLLNSKAYFYLTSVGGCNYGLGGFGPVLGGRPVEGLGGLGGRLKVLMLEPYAEGFAVTRAMALLPLTLAGFLRI